MKFEPGNIYHIYNRGNNRQQIFLESENYIYFLRKIRSHLSPLVDVLAYCLMPNHFHLLVYVPEEEELVPPDQSSDDLESSDDGVAVNVSPQIVAAVAVILRSYTRAINKKNNRSGSLFQQKTKAKNLSDENRDASFICFHYIHQNPWKAGLVSKMEEWHFSSFRDYAGLRDGSLCNKELAVQLLDILLDSEAFYQESYQVQILESTVKHII